MSGTPRLTKARLEQIIRALDHLEAGGIGDYEDAFGIPHAQIVRQWDAMLGALDWARYKLMKMEQASRKGAED